MDIDTDDEVLRTLANGQSIDYELWPGLLSRLIPRLEKIVHNDFPIPSVPHPHLPSSGPLSSSPLRSQVAETSSQDSTTSTDKENAPPQADAPPGTLPPQITYLLTSITSTLTTLFSKHPPHTVQRLAELILFPRQHYKTLPAYLHAVDRVVHVTSGAHTFPLPPAIPDPSSSSVLSNGAGVDPLSVSWGNRASAPQPSLGSDESLGGALLTPITWLTKPNGGTRSPLDREVKTESTEMIEGPNGPGGVETVSVSVNGIASAPPPNDTPAHVRLDGSVTQGELLRQEQRAGVVPVSQLEGHRGDADGGGEDDEVPHARGPEEIGMHDMGPQDAGSASQRAGPGVDMQEIDVEAAVGRKAEVVDAEPELPGTPKREAEEDIGADEKRVKMGEEDGKTGEDEDAAMGASSGV